jgi:hypothetical protein
MALSEGTIRSHNLNVIANVRTHNKKVKESNHRSFLHELDCCAKDTKNYDFGGMQHFTGGWGEKKETLSHKIYILQCRLNKESKAYRTITATLRKIKNFFTGMFRSKNIPGLPRIFR